jgi:hypothetical protein
MRRCLIHLNLILFILIPSLVTAAVNNNQIAIDLNKYYENPYGNIPSGGNTQYLIESQIANHSLGQKLFQDGTWNVFTAATYNYSTFYEAKPNVSNNTTYGYGTSLFGQTGRIGGFSFGGMITVDNPFFNSNLNGSRQNQGPWMTTKQLTQLNEAYIEYQYKNRVQADLGWISINDSPWLTPAYTLNNMNPAATYQGGIVHLYAGGGWLLTGLAFNAAQLGGATGMGGYTFYNQQSNGILPNEGQYLSNGTAAIGANYKALDNNYELRLWGYNFDNYGSLIYADNKINIPLTDKFSMLFGAQGGSNNSNFNSANNAFTNYQATPISSNFAGGLLELHYDWVNFGLAYNNIWGPSTAFGQGAIVAPYNANINDDPLFAEGWLYNMVNSRASGTGTKIFTKFSFLNGNLWVQPVVGSYTSSDPIWNGTREYDVQFYYAIPQVRGLSIFSIFAYQTNPNINPTSTSRFMNQLYLSYTY